MSVEQGSGSLRDHYYTNLSRAVLNEPFVGMFEYAYASVIRGRVENYYKDLQMIGRTIDRLQRFFKIPANFADSALGAISGKIESNFDEGFSVFVHAGQFRKDARAESLVDTLTAPIKGKFARWATSAVVEKLIAYRLAEPSDQVRDLLSLATRKVIEIGARATEEFEEIAIDQDYLDGLTYAAFWTPQSLTPEDLKTFIMNPPRSIVHSQVSSQDTPRV